MLGNMTALVLTVIGDDRAGIVSDLSDAIASHNANWSNSQLANLAGKFAGIVELEVPEDKVASLTAAVTALEGLEITVQAAPGSPEILGVLSMDVVADDRPGIVHQITEVVHAAGGNIEGLMSAVAEAPMSGGNLFTANLQIGIEPDRAPALREALEAITHELMVECWFEEDLTD